MSAEGKVSVKLNVADGRVSSVSLKSTRPLHLPQVMVGRTAQESVHTVSLLYRICGEAQSSASVQAIESAKGITPDMDKQWVRKQLLNMEIVREHVWRILLDWPVAQGGQPDRQAMADIMELANRWQKLLDPRQQAYQIGLNQTAVDREQVKELCAKCEDMLSRTIFSMPIDQWLTLNSATDILLWAAEEKTEAGSFLHGIVNRNWASLGQSGVRGLPDIDEQEIERLLTGNDIEAFISEPLLEGVPYESTSFSRCESSALITDLGNRFGNGLLTRFVAVLLEVALTMVEMRSEVGESPDNSATIKSGGSGVGVVEAARGRLIHRVHLKDDRVGSYQIVAPTEWNFHPHGALIEGLKNLNASDREGLEQQAHLLVYAMDPCVGYSLEVNGDA